MERKPYDFFHGSEGIDEHVWKCGRARQSSNRQLAVALPGGSAPIIAVRASGIIPPGQSFAGGAANDWVEWLAAGPVYRDWKDERASAR